MQFKRVFCRHICGGSTNHMIGVYCYHGDVTIIMVAINIGNGIEGNCDSDDGNMMV